MKTLDILTLILVIIGGLNWGLVALFELDLVAAILGPGSIPARVVYVLVALSALYQAVAFKAIHQRWRPRASRTI